MSSYFKRLAPTAHAGSLDVRPIGTPQPGRTAAWVSSPLDLVADEPWTSAGPEDVEIVDYH